MRLHRAEPAWKQIAEYDGPLVADARAERAGDKAALVAVVRWIAERVKRPITILELDTPSQTDFFLSDYILPKNIHVRKLALHDEYEGLDVHTPGLGADALWYLNAYLATQEKHPGRSMWWYEPGKPLSRTDEILFCLLTDSPYNARRNFDLECARDTVNALRAEGYSVEILYDKEHELFPDALKLPMKECVERIARAKCVIAGDTGFSHIAAAFGTPLIALYPDWSRYGMTDMTNGIKVSEWWEVPVMLKHFLPNAPYERLRVVEMSDHTWSVGSVLASLESYGKSRVPQSSGTENVPG